MLRTLSVIIGCILLIVVFPISAAAADDSLDAAVAKVKKMVDDGKPPAEIAQAVADIVDDQVTNVNSWERLTDWRNVFDFIPGVDNPKEAEFDAFRARGIPEYDETAQWVWNSQYGQCEECACLAYYILNKSGVPGNYRIYTTTAGDSGHNFVVWGMKDGADHNDPNTWGPNAYVVDGWTGKSLSAAEAFASSTYSSEGSETITDSTKAYDKAAAVWKVDEESSSDGDLFGFLDECFIATAVYGTKTAAEIDILRSFRDEFLADHSLGILFVGFYYQNSPPIAEYIAKRPVIRYMVKTYLVEPCVVITSLTESLWAD